MLRLSTPRRNEIRTAEVIGSVPGDGSGNRPADRARPEEHPALVAPLAMDRDLAIRRSGANMERKQLILNQSSGNCTLVRPTDTEPFAGHEAQWTPWTCPTC